ncbi:MAG: hypothetical protein GY719_10540 [bacterium]|nr:hypothetical protein [bacterium]
MVLLVLAWVPAVPATAWPANTEVLAANTAALPANTEVALPDSGYLSGPLDTDESQLGDEFFNFPVELGEHPRPGESPLAGWIHFRFEPVAEDPDRVRFTFVYDSTGPTDMWSFENGQTWLLTDNRAVSNPSPHAPNEGILNIRTGEIETIVVNPAFQNSVIADVTRNNRIPFAAVPTYPFDPELAGTLVSLLPPELVPLLIPPQLLALEPGFVFHEAFFTYSSEGRITGFKFFGWSILPAGLVAYLNPLLVEVGVSTFPYSAFGLNGDFFFGLPFECPPGTFCPTRESSPDGLLVDPTAFFRPYFMLGSKELAAVAEPPATAPDCAPMSRAGSLLLAHGDKLYQIGGRDPGGVTDRVDVYDVATRSWSEGVPLAFATADAQGGVIASKIYVYGGSAPSGEPRPVLQVFDPASGQWTQGADGPAPVAGGAAAVAGESLYIIGGRVEGGAGGTHNRAVLAYHAARPGLPAGWDMMDPEPEDAPILTEGASAMAVGAQIYVFGGKKLDPDTAILSVTGEVFVYSTISREFSPGPSLLWGVYDAAVGRVGNRIFLSGGRREVDGPVTADVQEWAIGQQSWRKTRPMPFPVAGAGSASVNGEIFFAGGTSPDSAATRGFQMLDVGRGWSICGSRPFFTAADVMNSASLVVGPRALSPGSLAVVTGYNLDGVDRVHVNGQPAEIVAGAATIASINSRYRSSTLPQRLHFRLPEGITGGSATIEVGSLAVEVEVAEAGPGIFLEARGEAHDPIYLHTASALACNHDGTLNYAANPARPGERVTLRMTGLGSAPSPAAVEVSIDGMPSLVDTVVPGSPTGLWQVGVVVPEVTRSANRLSVRATVAGVDSNVAGLAVLRPEDDGMVTRLLFGFPIPLPCAAPFAPCEGAICLDGGRFQVDVAWRTSGGQTGEAQAVPGVSSHDSGVLYFFDSGNWEMLVKVLDGCGINERYWVFAAAATDVEYTLTVTDRVTGQSTSYFNPLGTPAAPITDSSALAVCDAVPVTSAERLIHPSAPSRAPTASLVDKGTCSAGPTGLCLDQGRFRVEVDWTTVAGDSGPGMVVPFGGDDSGLFYFFAEDNWEMLVKVLDGCAVNERFWVFAAAATDVEYTLTVTDTETDQVREYVGPADRAIADTAAFATCPPPTL